MIDIEKILPLVQRPGRYINHELNTYPPRENADVKLCLCFPDLYEVGGSNLGLEILYHLVNRKTDAGCERCYAPADDMEAQLRSRSLPLFALESRRPVKSFDIVGFTLQYELCATNILAMLDLAGIPLAAKDRGSGYPLIIGGGPMTANPEPLAEFFDAFVLGDGEDAIVDIIVAVREGKAAGDSREKMLLRLARIEGVYVPSLYEVDHNPDGTVAAVRPVNADVPARVTKRVTKLDDAFFPPTKIVPYLQTVHNRLNIEIARGCASHCRFCQASRYYHPWRPRSKENILALVEKGMASTGFEEIAFSALSCTDYRGLDAILTEVNRRYASQRISISLPSLRCDQFSLQVASNLGYNKRSGLTFAPEAGTDRLRTVIGKNLPGTQIAETLSLAWRMGWRTIKLYFMIGLPTETMADVEGTAVLLRSIKKLAPGLNFTVTVSPFVPKAQTPFQWVAMARRDVIRERFQRLQKILPASVKGHYVESSILEGVFARGDRRLSAVIRRAWEKGCRFDQWKEHLKYDLWQQAFADCGLDPEFYAFRERSADEVLPWEHLRFGMPKDAMRKEYEESLAVNVTETPLEPAAAPAIPPPPPAPRPSAVLQTVQRLRLRFRRAGIVRFLSHLEQIEMFRRVMRRSGLPLNYTGGFSPQIKMAFGPAVSVGYESGSEYVEVELTRRVEPAEVQLRLAPALPEGYSLMSARKVPVFFPSLDSLLNVAEYYIGVAVTDEAIEKLLARKEIIIEKRKENRIERVDARPLIREMKREGDGLMLQLRFGPKRNVKPERVIQVLCGMTEEEAKLLPVERRALVIEKNDGSIAEP